MLPGWRALNLWVEFNIHSFLKRAGECNLQGSWWIFLHLAWLLAWEIQHFKQRWFQTLINGSAEILILILRRAAASKTNIIHSFFFWHLIHLVNSDSHLWPFTHTMDNWREKTQVMCSVNSWSGFWQFLQAALETAVFCHGGGFQPKMLITAH